MHEECQARKLCPCPCFTHAFSRAHDQDKGICCTKGPRHAVRDDVALWATCGLTCLHSHALHHIKLSARMHLDCVSVNMHVQEWFVTPCLSCAYCSQQTCSVKTTKRSTCAGRPSMTIVCRLGSNKAGVTPRFARIAASSRAAARASGDMVSVPAIGSAAEHAVLVYVPAAAVQRCAAGAVAGGC